MRLPEAIDQALGRSVGLGLAMWTFAGSVLRNGRVFHPEGELYRATVEPTGDEAAAALGERLAGRALVRLSTSLRRGQHAGRDLLGCAIRFGWDPELRLPESAVQDLLLATASRLVTLPFAPLLTDTRSYLANDYHSIARLRTEELGTVRIRAVPQREPLSDGPTRSARLAAAVAAGRAVFELQARGDGEARWRPFARVTLTGLADVADAELLFSPHHAALGLEPVGFLNALRRAPYPASRAGRRLAAGVAGALRRRDGPRASAAAARGEPSSVAARDAVRTPRTRADLAAPEPIALRSSRARRERNVRSRGPSPA